MSQDRMNKTQITAKSSMKYLKAYASSSQLNFLKNEKNSKLMLNSISESNKNYNTSE